MKLTEEIRSGIVRYMADHNYSGNSFAVKLGVAPSTVNRWISASGSGTIRPTHWAVVEPLIRSYLNGPGSSGASTVVGGIEKRIPVIDDLEKHFDLLTKDELLELMEIAHSARSRK